MVFSGACQGLARLSRLWSLLLVPVVCRPSRPLLPEGAVLSDSAGACGFLVAGGAVCLPLCAVGAEGLGFLLSEQVAEVVN